MYAGSAFPALDPLPHPHIFTPATQRDCFTSKRPFATYRCLQQFTFWHGMGGTNQKRHTPLSIPIAEKPAQSSRLNPRWKGKHDGLGFDTCRRPLRDERDPGKQKPHSKGALA